MTNILKNLLTFEFLLVVLPINLLGPFAIVYIIMSDISNIWWLLTLFGFIFIKEIGIAIGYHRVFSHSAFTPSKLAKYLMLLAGVLSGQGSPIKWAGIHKHHHKYSDSDRDPHCAKKGFLHSYFLWILKLDSSSVDLKNITHLIRDKELSFVHRHYVKFFVVINLLLIFLSLEFWLFAVLIPSFITFQVFNIQTSISHMKFLGYKDSSNNSIIHDSYNNIFLFPIVWGEAWHSNHHNDPKNINFGKRWWEIDPTYWLIRLLFKLK